MRTYAPRGQTPVLRVPLTRDHLSVIGGITDEGRLFHMVQTAAFRSGALDAWAIWDPFYAITQGGPGTRVLTTAEGVAPSN